MSGGRVRLTSLAAVIALPMFAVAESTANQAHKLMARAPASAQSESAEAIHWAYGAYFGTGRYTFGSGERAYVIGARPSWRWREAQLDTNGNRRVGVEFRLPVAIAAYRFELGTPGSTLRLDNIAALSVVPGIEFDIPVTERWSLKPLVHAGWGTELHGDASARIYWTGVKSRVSFQHGTLAWNLVNGLGTVGYSTDTGQRARVAPLLTGLEFERPLAGKTLRGEQVYLHWHVAHTNYLDELEAVPRSAMLEPVTIEDEWEVGAAFSTGHTPLRVWRLRWDRVGLAYRFSSGGDLQGVALTFRSLFDR